jgi:acetolactate synthase-1/2/3 large subunit
MAAAAEHLRQAGRVFLLAGLGVEASQAGGLLLELAEAWQAPVAVTPKAKGQFPEDHPLFAGCFTAYGDRQLRRALAESDLILGVGLDGVDFVTSVWDMPVPLINLNAGLADDPVTRPVVAVEGDMAQAIRALIPLRRASREGARLAEQVRLALARDLDTGHSPQDGRVRLLPLIDALQEALPPTGAITVDVGAFKLVLLQAWQARRPKSVFVANGLSAMGYALPGALAIKLAQPERPVAAILGDGALLMYAGELATAARLGLPLVILVVVDQALALIRLKQRRLGVPFVGTEFGAIDCEALAGAFGLEYLRLDRESRLVEKLSQALQAAGPILVEARVDKAEYDHFL